MRDESFGPSPNWVYLAPNIRLGSRSPCLKMKKIWSWCWGNRHMISAWGWIAATPLAVTIWKNSILFVIIASVYNNVKTDIATHNAQKAKEGTQNNDRTGS